MFVHYPNAFADTPDKQVLQYHRTITFDALLGGAEDVLSDLVVRQALRAMPKDTRL